MIIVDRALEQRASEQNPVRFAMVGAGFMGRGIVNQVVNSVPGMDLVAIANRHLDRAREAYEQAGVTGVEVADDAAEVARVIARGDVAITENAFAVTEADGIDAIVEVTGTVEYGASVVLSAIEHGKHVVLMNAELDGTIGPILKVRADEAGVIYTACDGDQPGVQMNLYRFVRSIGCLPLVCGNIKGLQDPYRNPTTQQSFAERWGQQPHMVTSFADGTKISFEQAIVANGTGMSVPQRGMYGRQHDGHVNELVHHYDVDALRAQGGIVDFVVGSQPGPGIFVLATHDDPKQRHYLNLYKLGEGPLYSFYTPYHLCHFEVPMSVARAVLFGDAVLAPLGKPRVDVIAVAKTDLDEGTTLDGMGWYMTYGVCENHDVVREEQLLLMGLAEGCRLKRPVAKDQALRISDVDVPEGRLHDRLRAEQDAYFADL